MRRLPVTLSSFSPMAASTLLSGVSPTGRLITMPSAPSVLWRTIRMTVWSKRGSRSVGAAIKIWLASDVALGAAPGSCKAACNRLAGNAIAARARSGRSIQVSRMTHPSRVGRQTELSREAQPRRGVFSPTVPPAPAAAPAITIIRPIIIRTHIGRRIIIDRRTHHVCGWRRIGAGRRRIVIRAGRGTAYRFRTEAEIGRNRVAVHPVPGHLAPAVGAGADLDYRALWNERDDLAVGARALPQIDIRGHRRGLGGGEADGKRHRGGDARCKSCKVHGFRSLHAHPGR